MSIDNAPNIYIDWIESEETPFANNMDMVMVDWKCTSDAKDTYWAVNNWDIGYSGFQNKDDKHLLMFAVWNYNTNPKIEYISAKGDMANVDFDGEDTGKHIVTDYNWKTNVWYTMCIGAKSVGGKTYYAQWIKEADDDSWFLTGIISITEANHYFNKCSLFQEPFTFNNEYRCCFVRLAYIRYHYNNTIIWKKLLKYMVLSKYYNGIDPEPQENVNENCSWGHESVFQTGDYVWISAGANNTIPLTFSPALYDPVSTPDPPPNYIPQWQQNNLQQYVLLQNNLSNKYAYPDSNLLKQRDEKYYWQIEYLSGTQFHIATTDGTKAITYITGYPPTVQVNTISYNSQNQKWVTFKADNYNIAYIRHNYYNIILLNNDTMGAALNNVLESKWKLIISTQIFGIKSLYSNKYVSPNPSISGIVQKTNKYEWNILYSGENDYYYILTTDNVYAITVNGTADGSELKFNSLSVGNINQMWKFEKTTDTDTSYYIKPRTDLNKNMDVRGPSMNPDAVIQLWTHNTYTTQFKWKLEF